MELVIERKGQEYRLAGEVERDGKAPLIRWTSHCAECGGEFQIITGRTVKVENLNRRCPEHVKPGVRVRRIEQTAVQ